MTKDFEVVDEEVTRTTADRISKEGRRARREFNGTTCHLQVDKRVVEELSKEGHLCWCNDDLRGHLQYLEDIGYRYVTNREASINREGCKPDARVKVRYGVADKEGHPQDVYLMLQPWEFYNEDQKAMAEAADMVDKQVLAEGKEVDHSYSHSVTYQTNK